jgi:hypothetical protein
MHINRDVFRDDLFHERDETLRDGAQDDARVGSSVDLCQLQDEIGGGRHPPSHRETEELLFRVDMAQHGSRRDAQLRCNIGERRPLEPLYCEDPPGGFKKLLSRDPRRPAH